MLEIMNLKVVMSLPDGSGAALSFFMKSNKTHNLHQVYQRETLINLFNLKLYLIR